MPSDGYACSFSAAPTGAGGVWCRWDLLIFRTWWGDMSLIILTKNRFRSRYVLVKVSKSPEGHTSYSKTCLECCI